ncbi:MAG: hypothetical protein HP491_04275 [Nitrospira sp.]|nr:hypothetical protein [Nitrospira sp.]MBH0184340.1 hypothetical protein [Nitrospira sp.]
MMLRWLSPVSKKCLLLVTMAMLAQLPFSEPAHAIIIEMEPDAYQVGTNVSRLFDGVTLSRFSAGIGDSFHYSPVFITGEHALAATGTRMFGYFDDALTAAAAWEGGCPPSCWRNDFFSALLIQFDRPTNFFEIAAEYQLQEHTRADDYPAHIVPFDSNGQFVLGPQTRTTLWRVVDDIEGPSMAESIQLGGLDRDPYISSVIIGGWENGVMLDRIRFNRVASVPEPSIALLSVVGLLFLATYEWRRRRQGM